MQNLIESLFTRRLLRGTRLFIGLGCVSALTAGIAGGMHIGATSDPAEGVDILPVTSENDSAITTPITLPAFNIGELTPTTAVETGDALAHGNPPALTSVPAPIARGDESDDGAIRWFNGRPVRPVRTIEMKVTAYSPDARSCGTVADGITASGYSVWTNAMKLAAADTRLLPLGTLITVPGYDAGDVVPVLDRGGAIKGNRLDMLFPTHESALVWGVQELTVTVWEYADGEPNDFKPRW